MNIGFAASRRDSQRQSMDFRILKANLFLPSRTLRLRQAFDREVELCLDRQTLVYIDLSGTTHLVGRVWTRARRDKEIATFEYERDWLSNPYHFSLEPALTVGPGPFHSGDRALFGAIGDSAPDRWGRVLMRRAERRRADREGQAPRTLQEIDYLLMVDDEARQGALRFAARAGWPFLAESSRKKIPPLIELPRLLSAAEHVW
jgi:serine/threonine-protein kinase HipA